MKALPKDMIKLMLAAALAMSSTVALAQAESCIPSSSDETPSNADFLCGPAAPAAAGTAVGGTSAAPMGGTLQGGSSQGSDNLDAVPEQWGSDIDD